MLGLLHKLLGAVQVDYLLPNYQEVAQLPSTKTKEQRPGPQLLSVVGGLFLARQHVQLTKTREQQPGPKLL